MSKAYEVHHISSPRAAGSLDWLLQWPGAWTPILTGLELNISNEHLTAFRSLSSYIITLPGIGASCVGWRRGKWWWTTTGRSYSTACQPTRLQGTSSFRFCKVLVVHKAACHVPGGTVGRVPVPGLPGQHPWLPGPRGCLLPHPAEVSHPPVSATAGRGASETLHSCQLKVGSGGL